MALSLSVKRAQAPKPCEMCETDLNIRWRCAQCKMFMCDKCRKLHSKVQTSVKHKIVSLQTFDKFEDSLKDLNTENIPCQIHKAKMTCMFCQTCDALICPECVSSHKKHDFEATDVVFKEITEKLKTKEKTIGKEVMLCYETLDKIEIADAKQNSLFDDSVKQVEERERELIRTVKEYAQEMKKKIEDERSRFNKRTLDMSGQLKQKLKHLTVQQSKIKEISKSTDVEDILKTVKGIDQGMSSDFNAFDQKSEVTAFVQGDTINFAAVFGSLHMIKTFDTNLPNVSRVRATSNSNVWVSNYSKDLIQEVNLSSNFSVVREINMKILDMASTHEGLLFFSVSMGSDVKFLSKAGEIKQFISVAPLLTNGIHVTKDKVVLVGVREDGRGNNSNSKRSRKIIGFGMDGTQKLSYEFDKNKQPLLTLPYRITTNVNQNILVIDKISNESGIVLNLEQMGNITWKYEGHPKINADMKFNPQDITTTSEGYVIVGDYNTHSLHVLSCNGNLISCKVVEKLGIVHPLSLDFGASGELLVGCGGDSKEKSNAKLHILHFFQK